MVEMRRLLVGLLPIALGVTGCKGDGSEGDGASSSGDASTSTGSASAQTGMTVGMTSPSGTDTSGSEATTATDEGPVFDVGSNETGTGTDTGVVPTCKVVDDMNAVPDCMDVAPPDSFEPDVQWAWAGDGEVKQVLPTPVIANLTDDNNDDEIDLCDIPDIVVTAYEHTGYLGFDGKLFVLDGETGAVHFSPPEVVAAITYPAIGDIDNDGIPEIVSAVTVGGSTDGQLAAWEHDGTLKWMGDTTFAVQSSAVALADLDNDGDIEIMLHGHVADHNGVELWQAGNTGAYVNTAADLDGDDDMEVILGGDAYHHDGTPYFNAGVSNAHPQVADLDNDGLPEVMLVGSGITILEHDGSVKVMNQQPMLATWRPAAIHDMDADMAPEIAVGASNNYSVLEADLTPVWTAQVLDGSGYAAGTAFDFLGDGSAEAMYADETTLFIFDGQGQPLLTTTRESWTQWENPAVADVDNDGSAEIVVVSNRGYNMGVTPPVQVIRDIQDRWIPARRIWNQHTYHVTNVREDGTIPMVEPKHWTLLNTFRTQAQIGAGGGVCQPDPEG